MRITVAQARPYLLRYVGAQNSFLDQLNLTTMRLIQSGNWPNSKNTVIFDIHVTDDFKAFITLPWQYETVLAAVVLRANDDQSRRCGWPLQIRDEWFSYLPGGVGFTQDARFQWGNGLIPEIDRFTTFKDWATPKFLRLKFAATEANGLVFNIRGEYLGQPIYTGTGSGTTEGENLVTVGATTLTTTSQFSKPPSAIVKPSTYGVVSLYTWDGVTEELVARYMPEETFPQWRRYRVPACSNWTEADPGQLLTICKREWTSVSNDNDEVVPGNLGALRFGMEALLKENAQDFTRAEEWWGKAYQLLANEVEDDQGAGATSPVQVADSFMMADGAYNGGWNGNGYNSGFYGN